MGIIMILGIVSAVILIVIGSAILHAFVIATLLPHGIIEIPTIILCSAMGVGLGYKIVHRILRRDGLQKYAIESIMVFIKRIIPLLVLAAGIETALIYYFV